MKLYDPAGELVGKVQGAAGSGQATWDSSGLASGLYLAVVEVTGPAGFVDRKILQIAILP